jgi:hypothetical protein
MYVSQLLPLCTPGEWIILASALRAIFKKERETIFRILMFVDAVFLLCTVIKRKGFEENDCAVSCLEYCIGNLVSVLKVCTN